MPLLPSLGGKPVVPGSTQWNSANTAFQNSGLATPSGTATLPPGYANRTAPQTSTNYTPSATPSTAAPATSAPANPNAYNASTVYPGPYSNNADNYKVWLNNGSQPISTPTAGTDPNATAGTSPYMALATGNGPTGSFNMGNQGFATPAYAQSVAKATGGTVNQATPFNPGSPFFSNQPQNLVTTGAGNVINPAVLAALYGHGYSQSYVNQLAQNYMNGTDAYNSGVPSTLAQNSFGYNTNAPMAASQNFQAGTTPNAQVLAQNPGSIPNGFLGSGQTVSNNPATYNAPNPNQGAGAPNPYNSNLVYSPQNQGPTPSVNPLYFMSPQIQQLYGGNPYGNATSAMGSGALGSLLQSLANGGNGNGNNLTSIAALLNLFNSGQQYSGNSNLNPLFFNNGSQASSQLYYPLFY